mmetsp:Transcript_13563/g.21189  ORF Transcript_13563/g.21189 Transcript_13563/m.21189 type:complete len:205 (-) Transcript_13563:280-894(-)
MSEVLQELLPEMDHQKIRTKTACLGAARLISEAATPCRCSGFNRQSLWHNHGMLQESLEDLIWRLVMDMEDAHSIVVASVHSLFKFLERSGQKLCRDQLLRLTTVSVCLNAKFWDDREACRRTNRSMAFKSGIPMDEIGSMELLFLRELDWNVCICEEKFLECEARIEAKAEAWYKEQEATRQSNSPLSSTDVVDELGQEFKQL